LSVTPAIPVLRDGQNTAFFFFPLTNKYPLALHLLWDRPVPGRWRRCQRHNWSCLVSFAFLGRNRFQIPCASPEPPALKSEMLPRFSSYCLESWLFGQPRPAILRRIRQRHNTLEVPLLLRARACLRSGESRTAQKATACDPNPPFTLPLKNLPRTASIVTRPLAPTLR